MKYVLILRLVALSCCATAQEQPVQPDVHMVPMPDGVSLHTEVFLPQKELPAATILLRSPYSKHLKTYASAFAPELVALGFAVVVQDCRGTGESRGVWDPYLHEVRDGVATIRWIREQSWCNGAIGTCGGSYLGYTQWAIGIAADDSLKAMYTEVPTFDWYETTYGSGAFRLDARVTWNTFVARPRNGEPDLIQGELSAWDWNKAYRYLPLQTWDIQLGSQIPWMRSSVNHPEYDDYWRQFQITDRLHRVSVPNLTVTGWYDLFLDQALKYVPEVRRTAATQVARDHQHMIIGPCGHEPNVSIGDREFGHSPAIDLTTVRKQWYGHWLRGENTGVDQWPFLRLFVMGTNQWRDENEWPLARTVFTKFYFSSDGQANSLTGDGGLTRTPTDGVAVDRFTYDPSDPVPTLGGEWQYFAKCGPIDQRGVERRRDVLVYTSQPLIEPIEATGPVQVVLFAATTARDTDWTAKLVDVYPDGRAFNLCDGIVRSRYPSHIVLPIIPQRD